MPAERVDGETLAARLEQLGADGDLARALDSAAEALVSEISSLSSLSSPLAVDYLERLRRPLSALSLEQGASVVARGYAAHMAVEADPTRFGADGPPEPGAFPKLRRNVPRQDILNRVVKASRRPFRRIRAVPEGVWEGFALCATRRLHDSVPGEEPDTLLGAAAVDGLARFGWTLRHADAQYGLEPERRF